MATEIERFINGALAAGKGGRGASVFHPATGEESGRVPLANMRWLVSRPSTPLSGLRSR
jgi:hypothetical protein